MKLLYGTGNLAKLDAMQSRLKNLGIELIGLHDLIADGITVPKVSEDGDTPLQNARQKAIAYYEAFKVQPGVHVRTINGKRLSDEEMMEYYAELVRQYGKLTARYRNAICFVKDENHIYGAMEPSMESEKFILTDIPHSKVRKRGFPLDSMSIDIKTKKYFYDLPADKLGQVAVEDGFVLFFQRILNHAYGIVYEAP